MEDHRPQGRTRRGRRLHGNISHAGMVKAFASDASRRLCGRVRFLAQEDLKGHPEVNRMGVPLTIELAKTDEDRQVMELIYSQNAFGRPYVLPPGVPAERVAALRQAFTAALHDRNLLEEA